MNSVSAGQNTALDAPGPLEKIDCPVCAGNRFTLLFEKLGEPFVRCDECGLVLINPRPLHTKVLDTYTTDYSHHYAVKGVKKFRRCKRWVERVKKSFSSSGRWLDIGCSVGFVVKAANEAGYEGHGIDVEDWGIRHGREELGLKNLVSGTLEQQHYPDAYFDVISLYDVIEHVPDLNLLVRELKRTLARNGVIDIITPDLGHWRTPSSLNDWNEIKPSEHLYYFDIRTLSRLLEKHALHVVKKRFHFKPSLRVYVQHQA